MLLDYIHWPSLSLSQLKNGLLQYVSDAGVAGKVERIVGDVVLSDSQWHTLLLQRNGSSTILRIDESSSKVILHNTQDFGGIDVHTLSLGGVPALPTQQRTSPGQFPSVHVLYNLL